MKVAVSDLLFSQSKLRKTGLSQPTKAQSELTVENDEPEKPKKDVATLMKERIAAAKKSQSKDDGTSPAQQEESAPAQAQQSPDQAVTLVNFKTNNPSTDSE